MKTFEEKCAEASCGVELIPGWIDIIKSIDEHISAHDPDYIIDQIKEKFGTLRFYFSFSEDSQLTPEKYTAIWEFVSVQEHKTGSLCQECGTPGEKVSRNGWYTTTCDDCYRNGK